MTTAKKKTNNSIKIIRAVLVTITALLAATGVLFVLIPYIQDKNAEKRKAEEAAEHEAARLEMYNRDLMDFTALEYEAVLLSMPGNENWSADGTIKGYLGYDWVRNNEELNSDEFKELLDLALVSGNPIECFYMVLDPVKMFKATKTDEQSAGAAGETGDDQSAPLYELNLDIAAVADANPDISFTVYTPFYSRQYWDNVKFADYPYIIAFYEKVLKSLVKCKNVKVMDFTGENWLIDNPALYEDIETGDLRSEVYEKLFLYSFIPGRELDKTSVGPAIVGINENCLTKTDGSLDEVKRTWFRWPFTREKEEPATLPLEDYDIVFMGDSIFALNDGVYSIPSVVSLKTGARTYNISRGGMPAAPYEDVFNLSDAVKHFIDKTQVGSEETIVYDTWLKKYMADDHTGRKLIIVFDACANDYICSLNAFGDTADTTEGAYDLALRAIKKAYPDCEIVCLKPYTLQMASNGTNVNDAGYRLSDYKEGMEKAALANGCIVWDMQDYGEFDLDDTHHYLDDGVHPSVSGSYEIAAGLSDALIKTFGSEPTGE